MTTNMDNLAYNEENSNCSLPSDSNSDGSFVNSNIINEEMLLERKQEREELEAISKKENEMIKDTDDELRRQREIELQTRRYKKLKHLLENSRVYSMIIKETFKKEVDKSKISPGRKNQTKNESSHNKDYSLGDIITEETFDRCQEVPEVKEEPIDDYFKVTRVTSLGFTVSYKQPMLLEGATLKDYQLKGLDWLKVLFSNGVNGILADEMGLGKTIQVIAFICYMIEQNIQGPFLIVAPLSTVSNWMSEFKRFAPSVPIMLYHGNEEERMKLFPEILKMNQVQNRSVHKVIITSYQIPLRDRSILQKISWYYLIVDEGHCIKNHKSQLSRTLREFNTIGRLILTGTPLQNDLSELWSLLNFLLPEIFNTLGVFESWFDIKELESNSSKFMTEKLNLDVVTILREILVPFLLRREKKDVDLKLPPKKEILIYCPMTQQQKELYAKVLDRSIERLLPKKVDVDELSPLPKRRCFMHSPYGKKNSVRLQEPINRKTESDDMSLTQMNERFITNLKMNNPSMMLRKIANHPYLIQHPLHEGTEELRIDEDLVKESGKMLILDALLTKLKAGGHKVILFTYFKLVLDILEDYAIMRKHKYCRLDGGKDIRDREEEIQNFNSNPDIFLFLITLRSGGLGINLTTADTVIFFDSDWNPQINIQSQDRCHRIGQLKPVVIYRLCVRGTIDEKIIQRGNAKRRLEKMILQKGKYTLNSKLSKTLTYTDLQELKILLESSDHNVVVNSNGLVLTEEELESLLDRSTMVTENMSEE